MGRLPKPLNEKEKLSLWQTVAHAINDAAYEFLNPNLKNDYRMYAGLRRGLRGLCAFSPPKDEPEGEGAWETWATKSSSIPHRSLRS